jgi:hypothetical protein
MNINRIGLLIVISFWVLVLYALFFGSAQNAAPQNNDGNCYNQMNC